MNPLHKEKQVATRSPFLLGAMMRWRFLLAAGLAIGLQTDHAIEYFTGPVRGLSRALASTGHYLPDWIIQIGPYLPAIFCLIRAVYLLLYAWSCRFVLTDQRLIVRYGICRNSPKLSLIRQSVRESFSVGHAGWSTFKHSID